MQDIIFSALPSWLLFLVIVGGGVTLACAALWLIRLRIKVPTSGRHNEVAGFLFATVGVVYATLLGFLVVSVWDEFNSADRAVSQEAASLISVIRYSAFLPEPARGEMHDRLHQYIAFVSQDEWKAMSHGQGQRMQSGNALTDINAMWKIYQQQPATATNVEAMRNLNDMAQDRLLRLEFSTGGLPGIFWVVLVLGGIVVIGFGLIFYMENMKFHMMLIALMTFLITLCLWFILVVNNPFDGDLLISSEVFHFASQVLDSFPR